MAVVEEKVGTAPPGSNTALVATGHPRPQGDGQARPALSQRRCVLLVLLTVALFLAAFPGGHAPWSAWFVWVPLGLALRSQTRRDAFMLAFGTAFLAWLWASWWVMPGLARSAGTPGNSMLLLGTLFCLYAALPYGIAGLIVSRARWLDTTGGALAAALLWTAIVGFYPHPLPGSLAHSQYVYPRMIQILDLGGSSLLFFVVHWINFLLVAAIHQARLRPGASLRSVALGMAVCAVTAGYGHFRLLHVSAMVAQPGNPRFTVGMLQPNLPVSGRDRFAWEQRAAGMEAISLALAHMSPTPDVIVWPEIPPPVSYAGNAADRARIDRLVQNAGVPLFVTGHLDPGTQRGSEQDGYFNSAELVKPDGSVQIYHKTRLLPFGEYLPGERLLPVLRTLFPSAPDYRPGAHGAVFRLNGQVRLIPLICYEALFPRLVAAGVSSGGNVMVNTVNDAWFGDTAGPEIHLALASFRSVEFRLPLVRVTNSGISALITPTGEIAPSSRTETFRTAAGVHAVPIAHIQSPYARTGDLFLWVAGVASLMLLLRKYLSPYRRVSDFL